jgi:NTE family protein
MALRQGRRRMKIGLALGGGSARGLAHIPVLETFDELGLKPSIIAGCSIGAMIGAAYASGIPACDLRAHALRLLSTRMDAAKYVFGTKRAKLRDLLALKSFASLHIEGETLARLSMPDGVAANVEDTLIPLRIITCDYETQQERVIASGPMARAVGASIAIPGIIAAPRIDGAIHIDGGVINPVPFNHAREGMDIVVAIDVTGRPRSRGRQHPSNVELAIGSMLIMFRQIADLRRAQDPPDIYIEPPVEQFGATEFFRAAEMFKAAEPVKERLKRALHLRIEGPR